MAKPKFTPLELQIMQALWDRGPVCIRDIQESIPEPSRPAYTTVQTIVRRLEEKGAVRRVKKIGNAFIFEPLISRRSAHHRLITELLELFGGSARPLMAHLAETGKLNLEDVRELETLLAKPAEMQKPKVGARGSSNRAKK